MSITAGRLICIGGKTSPAWGDPGWWESPSVVLGTVIVDLKITDVTNSVEFGMDTDAAGNITGYGYRIGADTLKPVKNGVVGPTLFVPADNTEYTLYVSVSDKAYYFIKGGSFTYPALLWIDTTYALSLAYIGLANYDAAWVADNLRMSPVAVAATVLSSTQTAPTPTTTGSELLTNPGFEGTYVSGVAPGWTNLGTGTAAEENTIVHGGTSAQKLTRAANSDRISQSVAGVSVGKWYRVTMWLYSAQAGGSNVRIVAGSAAGNATYGEAQLAPVSTWTQVTLTLLNTGTVYVGMWLTALGTIGYADDASVKEILLSSLISVDDTGSADGMFKVNLTVPLGAQGGLALNVDSASSPSNKVNILCDRTSLIIRKLVSGTWTVVNTTAITYVDAAELLVWKFGTSYRIYYNGAFVVTVTISDGSIVNNTKHGRFRTDSSVTLVNYAAYAIGGSTVQYTTLDAFGVLVTDGAIAPTGSVVKSTAKTLLGTISPTGIIAKKLVKLLTGFATPTGGLTKQTWKVFGGSVSPAGYLINSLRKLLTGSVAPTGALRKQANKYFDGSLSPSGGFSSALFSVIRRIISFLTFNRNYANSNEAGVITKHVSNVSLYAGETLLLRDQVANHLGAGVGISGASLTYRLFPVTGGIAILQKTIGNGISVLDVTDGTYEIYVTASDSVGLLGEYFHVCEVMDLAGNTTVTFSGSVVVSSKSSL